MPDVGWTRADIAMLLTPEAWQLLIAGIGIAFFMVMVHRTRDAAVIAHVAGTVVIADAVFTRDRGGAATGHRRLAGAPARLVAR